MGMKPKPLPVGTSCTVRVFCPEIGQESYRIGVVESNTRTHAKIRLKSGIIATLPHGNAEEIDDSDDSQAKTARMLDAVLWANLKLALWGEPQTVAIVVSAGKALLLDRNGEILYESPLEEPFFACADCVRYHENQIIRFLGYQGTAERPFWPADDATGLADRKTGR